jgi:hypothetical protein
LAKSSATYIVIYDIYIYYIEHEEDATLLLKRNGDKRRCCLSTPEWTSRFQEEIPSRPFEVKKRRYWMNLEDEEETVSGAAPVVEKRH